MKLLPKSDFFGLFFCTNLLPANESLDPHDDERQLHRQTDNLVDLRNPFFVSSAF